MTISETIKAKLDGLEIERHVGEAVATAEKGILTAVGKTGDYVHTHRDQIGSWLDKASATIDDKTDGKFAAQVTKVRGYVEAGVSKVAEQRPADSDGPTA